MRRCELLVVVWTADTHTSSGVLRISNVTCSQVTFAKPADVRSSSSPGDACGPVVMSPTQPLHHIGECFIAKGWMS